LSRGKSLRSELRGQLKKFLESQNRNQWLRGRHVSAYVRKGHHLGPDGKLHHYLDLASIEVDIEFWGKGIFSEFLCACQKMTPYDGVFVECVLDKGLISSLRRKVEQNKQWSKKDSSFIWEKPINTKAPSDESKGAFI
jgi:hypothetical protein